MSEQAAEDSLEAEPSPSPADTAGGIRPAGTHTNTDAHTDTRTLSQTSCGSEKMRENLRVCTLPSYPVHEETTRWREASM